MADITKNINIKIKNNHTLYDMFYESLKNAEDEVLHKNNYRGLCTIETSNKVDNMCYFSLLSNNTDNNNLELLLKVKQLINFVEESYKQMVKRDIFEQLGEGFKIYKLANSKFNPISPIAYQSGLFLKNENIQRTIEISKLIRDNSISSIDDIKAKYTYLMEYFKYTSTVRCNLSNPRILIKDNKYIYHLDTANNNYNITTNSLLRYKLMDTDFHICNCITFNHVSYDLIYDQLIKQPIIYNKIDNIFNYITELKFMYLTDYDFNLSLIDYISEEFAI